VPLNPTGCRANTWQAVSFRPGKPRRASADELQVQAPLSCYEIVDDVAGRSLGMNIAGVNGGGRLTRHVDGQLEERRDAASIAESLGSHAWLDGDAARTSR